MERIKLIFALGENVMSFIEDSWPGKTSHYIRKKEGVEFPIKGNRSVSLVIQTKDERHHAVLVGIPELASAEYVSALTDHAMDKCSGDQVLLVGTAKTMKAFLPREPRIGSRYQPIIGIPGVNWGILIRRREEGILCDDHSCKSACFTNELVSLVWNLERELREGGKLRSAKSQYEGTWRDPWDTPYRCKMECSACAIHRGRPATKYP